MYSRLCPICSKELTYAKKYNLDRAIKKKAICKSCKATNISDETRAKMSSARKELLEKRTAEEQEEITAKMKNTLREHWENKTEEELEEWKKQVSATSKERWANEEYREKTSKSIKQSWDELSWRAREKRISKSLDNGAGRCKYFDERGYRVQGLTEKRFVIYFCDNDNIKSPLKERPKAIRTPMGLYYPDFITEDGVIYEVKSKYTFDILGTKRGKSQYEKMKWINENNDNIKIILFVEQKDKSFRTYEDLTDLF